MPAPALPRGTTTSLLDNDLFWLVACLATGVACLVALIVWIARIVSGQIDGTRLSTMLFIVLIYVLCVGCGWLLGRSQLALELDEQQREVLAQRQEIERLGQLNQKYQQDLARLQTQDTLQPGTPRRVSPSPATPQRVSPPSAGAAQSPPLTIYDQQYEPSDLSDMPNHPHEKRFPAAGEVNTLDHGWQIIGASRRGYGHGYERKYREDDFKVTILNDRRNGPPLALVAIADGVGSKELSRRGALAAVQGAASLSEQHVAPLKTLLANNPAGYEDQIASAAKRILQTSLRTAYESVERAAYESQTSLDELQTTLLVFLAVALSPDQLFLAFVQVGDGAILGLKSKANSSGRWRQLLKPQIQATGNEVHPFTRSNEQEWQQFMSVKMLRSYTGIMSMTDGIADDIEPPLPSPGDPQPDPFLMVERFYQSYVAPVAQSTHPADELLKLIGYHRKQSHDDRTLVYLYRL